MALQTPNLFNKYRIDLQVQGILNSSQVILGKEGQPINLETYGEQLLESCERRRCRRHSGGPVLRPSMPRLHLRLDACLLNDLAGGLTVGTASSACLPAKLQLRRSQQSVDPPLLPAPPAAADASLGVLTQHLRALPLPHKVIIDCTASAYVPQFYRRWMEQVGSSLLPPWVVCFAWLRPGRVSCTC